MQKKYSKLRLLQHFFDQRIQLIWFFKIGSFTLIFILNLCLKLYAQQQDIKFDCLTLEDGLSQTTVICIIQDAEGYMWFGTVDGLNKFDGCNFTIYRNNPADSNSLSDDWITSMYIDQNNLLWIGTLGGGLNKFDRKKGNFTYYHLELNSNVPAFPKKAVAELPFIFNFFNFNSIKSICEDKSGTLWIGTFGNGLYKFDRDQKKFIHCPYETLDANGLNYNIISMCVTSDSMSSTLWIGTFGGGLIKFNEKEGFTFYLHDPSDPNSLSNNRIISIYPYLSCDKNILWVGTLGGGLDKFDIIQEKFTHYKHDPQNPNSLSDNRVMAILKDRRDVLWIGMLGGGLDKFDLETGQFTHYLHEPSDPNSLGSNDVISLFEDRTGIIWVGTNLGHGINKFQKQKNKFAYYYHNPSDPNSLSDNVVFSIFEDRASMLWIGTFQRGISKFDRAKSKFTHYRHDPMNPNSLSDNHIRAIYEDSHRELWIGTFSGGLNKFDTINNKFMHYKHDPSDPNSLGANQVRSILEDRFGNLWIGTFGGGLNKFNRESETFSHYQHDPSDSNSLSDDRIYSISEDSSGSLWIATFEGGFDKFDLRTEKFTNYRHDPLNANSLSDNRVFSIQKDPNDSSTFWIGTSGGGLNKFDSQSQTFTHFTEQDGLPNNVVYGVLFDNEGNLWLSTNKGLSKFNPKTETFTNYNLDDGLQSNEFNAGSYHKTKSGEMFFGGINGFNCFYPGNVQINQNIPPIVLTSFKVFDQDMSHLIGPISEAKQIELSYKDSFFSFEFSALDYTNLKKNQFAYKMEGFNKDWIKCGTRRFVSYTNLDPGEYTFRVKGSNCDGMWNEAGTSVKLKIQPPFWFRWWFHFFYIGFTIFTVALIYRRRLKRSLELERVRMAENERVRKMVAADFHDELGQKLTKISLFSEIVKRKLKTISPANIAYLDKIHNAAKELSDSTRDFIWTIDPVQDTFYDVAIYLKDFGDEMFDKTGIDFRISGILKELENIRLPMKWRRHLILIFKEAMNNVLKHAECKNVMFDIRLNHNKLEITLSDDGVGCDLGKISSGLGLNNMKHRAELIQGRINIIPNDRKGTTIQFVSEIPQMGD